MSPPQEQRDGWIEQAPAILPWPAAFCLVIAIAFESSDVSDGTEAFTRWAAAAVAIVLASSVAFAIVARRSAPRSHIAAVRSRALGIFGLLAFAIWFVDFFYVASAH